MQYAPVYSNVFYGTTSGAGFTGSLTGDPIWIVGAWGYVSLQITLIRQAAGTARGSIFVESNSGTLDEDGVPPAAEWITQFFFPVAAGGGNNFTFDKKIPVSGKPAWRTRWVRTAGGINKFVSYVPYMRTKDGQYISAGRPPGSSDTSLAVA